VYVSKRSTMRAVLWRGSTPVDAATLAAKRGTFSVKFTRPQPAGDYRIAFGATALTGQRSETEAFVTLRKRPKR
jgi:hypothetical protein